MIWQHRDEGKTAATCPRLALILALSTAFAIGVALADEGADTTAAAPRIHFPEPTHDFGNLTQGDRVTHTFEVQNLGDAPLNLIRAKGT